jgi:hypothetical protein
VVPEGRVKRLLLAVAVLCNCGLLTPDRAAAAEECRGLDVCISVPGPWVAVPAAPRSGTRTVLYRLSCPRNAIAAGTDALRPRGLEVTFVGATGSPISPGVTTEREVWFVAVWAGSAPATFRPFLGCVPTSGGGRSTTARAAAAPQPPFVRRARNVTRSGSLSCRAGERLVAVSHAVGFRLRTAPAPVTLNAVRVNVRRRGNRVVADVGRTVRGAHVQLQALCARRSP